MLSKTQNEIEVVFAEEVYRDLENFIDEFFSEKDTFSLVRKLKEETLPKQKRFIEMLKRRK